MGAAEFLNQGAAAVGSGFLVGVAVYGQHAVVALTELVVQHLDGRDEHGDGGLHVGHAGTVGEVSFPVIGTAGGFAGGKDRIVMGEHEHACLACALERCDDVVASPAGFRSLSQLHGVGAQTAEDVSQKMSLAFQGGQIVRAGIHVHKLFGQLEHTVFGLFAEGQKSCVGLGFGRKRWADHNIKLLRRKLRKRASERRSRQASKQATIWPGEISLGCGRSCRQRSVASGQRGWK